MVPAGGSLRDRGHLSSGLGASEHPHGVEEEGAWEWASVPLDGSIDGFQASARGKIPILKGQELFMGKEVDGWPGEKGYFDESGVALPVYSGGRQFILFFAERGVMARTNPKTSCRFLTSPAGTSVVPTIATSLPVPMGLTLWWCASLASRLKTSVWPRLGCRNANASCPALTFQWPNSLPLKRNSNTIGCHGSRIGPALCMVSPVSL